MGFFEDLMRSFGGGHHGRRRGHHGERQEPYGYGNPYPYAPPPDPTRGGNPGITCPKCSSPNLPNARFCQQCAAPLTSGQCAKCGATLAAGVKFCSQCGQQV
jgi:ribosomal protein L40E